MGSPPFTRGKPAWRRVRRVDDRLIPTHAGKTGPDSNRHNAHPAHPRSRGENISPPVSPPVTMGSSPLTRGKRVSAIGFGAHPGLIPAHAGKTTAHTTAHPASQAHPHSRGENTARMIAAELEAGSSPLTRGKHRAVRRAGRQRGLIPTHAGKTYATDKQSLHNLGSSPLTRGKPSARRGPPPARGLIPTHAGKTPTYGGTTSQPQAHPRSRGENIMEQTADAHGAGSSPLTRGKRGGPDRRPVRGGFIPAHAGKTTTGSPPRTL